jgi:hypothetical protein
VHPEKLWNLNHEIRIFGGKSTRNGISVLLPLGLTSEFSIKPQLAVFHIKCISVISNIELLDMPTNTSRQAYVFTTDINFKDVAVNEGQAYCLK